jgi:ferredoxin
MTSISLDDDLCNGCGMCASVCGRGVLIDSQGGILINGDVKCSACGHCLAICPGNALRHELIDQSGSVELDGKETPAPEEFARFVKARRSHRKFENKDVPPELIQACINLCRYCPTGSNCQSVEVMVITDPEFICQLSGLTVDHFRQVLKITRERLDSQTVQEGEIPPDLALASDRMPLLKKMITKWDDGYDPILRSAPVVLVFPFNPLCEHPQG